MNVAEQNVENDDDETVKCNAFIHFRRFINLTSVRFVHGFCLTVFGKVFSGKFSLQNLPKSNFAFALQTKKSFSVSINHCVNTCHRLKVIAFLLSVFEL